MSGDAPAPLQTVAPGAAPRAVPASVVAPAPQGSLAAALGSEDGLFRDPFADFSPSRR